MAVLKVMKIKRVLATTRPTMRTLPSVKRVREPGSWSFGLLVSLAGMVLPVLPCFPQRRRRQLPLE
jgi:hypothetical protein